MRLREANCSLGPDRSRTAHDRANPRPSEITGNLLRFWAVVANLLRLFNLCRSERVNAKGPSPVQGSRSCSVVIEAGYVAT